MRHAVNPPSFHHATRAAVPAEAGGHTEAICDADRWVPAFAGTTI
jgi:hypothetical protein